MHGLGAALKTLAHQSLCCNFSPVEGVHFLLQLPTFLLQVFLFLLVHSLQLLKPVMKLDTIKRPNLGLCFFDFVYKHLPHLLFFALQLQEKLSSLGFIGLLKTGCKLNIVMYSAFSIALFHLQGTQSALQQ
ncbi:hypothetical protein NL108_014878 [Boleophthalmus pectinirostris]|nr:hypothetical protein NL108_014878 [Boleophthalmus pectinirostris]